MNTFGQIGLAVNCGNTVIGTTVLRCDKGSADVRDNVHKVRISSNLFGAPIALGTQSLYGTAPLTAKNFTPTQSPASDVSPRLEGLFVTEGELDFLSGISKEVEQLEECESSRPAKERLFCVAEVIASDVLRNCHCRWAVFGGEDGAVELVVHEGRKLRQVTFEVFATDDRVKVTRIDREMNRSEQFCRILHKLQLKEAIAWLRGA